MRPCARASVRLRVCACVHLSIHADVLVRLGLPRSLRFQAETSLVVDLHVFVRLVLLSIVMFHMTGHGRRAPANQIRFSLAERCPWQRIPMHCGVWIFQSQACIAATLLRRRTRAESFLCVCASVVMVKVRCSWVLPDAPRCFQMISDAPRCSQMLPASRCSQMHPDALRCSQNGSDAFRCSQMVADAPRCSHMLTRAASRVCTR